MDTKNFNENIKGKGSSAGAFTLFKNTTYLDSIIEKGLTFLLIFTPLAIGTVQTWSISVMEIAVFIILCASFLKMVREERIIFPNSFLTFFIFCLLFLVFLQIVPMHASVLDSISPYTNELFKTFTDVEETGWRTISLQPGATRDDLLKLISYVAVFFVIINQYRTKEQVSGLVRVIICVGCFIAIFAVIQKMAWNGKLFWFYPLKEGLYSNRTYIWGPYINHNHFAGYMEMAIPLGLGLLLYRIAEINNPPGISLRNRLINISNSSNLAPMVFIFIAVLIMTGVLFYSLSRGGITGFAVSLIFLGGLISRRRSMKWLTRPIMIIGLILFLVVVPGSLGRIEGRFEEVIETEKIARFDLWPDAIGMARDFPLFGTGLGTFVNIFPKYQTRRDKLIFEHAENDYIEILTDMGISGLLLTLGLIITFFYTMLRVWFSRRSNFVKCMAAGGLSSCLAILVHGLSDFNFRIPANALLLVIIASMVHVSLFNIKTKNKQYEKREYRFNKWKLSVCVIIFVITGFLLSFPIKTLKADYHYKKAASSLDDPSTPFRDVVTMSRKTIVNYNSAITSLKTAIAIKPSVSAYYAELCGIYVRAGKWAEVMQRLNAHLPKIALQKEEAYNNAIKYLKRAILLNPVKAKYHLALGQIYQASKSDFTLSEKEQQKVLLSAPYQNNLRLSMAFYYLNTGRGGDALAQAKHVAKIDTSYIPSSSMRRELESGVINNSHARMIYKSYLFQALEIAWRVSSDPEIVKGIAPDTPEAERVVTLFLESKGLSS